MRLQDEKPSAASDHVVELGKINEEEGKRVFLGRPSLTSPAHLRTVPPTHNVTLNP